MKNGISFTFRPVLDRIFFARISMVPLIWLIEKKNKIPNNLTNNVVGKKPKIFTSVNPVTLPKNHATHMPMMPM